MILLILGSGPTALRAAQWPREPFDRIVAINNAWRIRDDWDDLVYPYDFPLDRQPRPAPHQNMVDQTHFVPAQNTYGGFVFGGATMAFTATYWALWHLKPRIIAYIGCDMVYPKSGQTHFYGAGTADPLRQDISLRSLEARSARAMALAGLQGCALINLSRDPSRLVFPRTSLDDVAKARPVPIDPAQVQTLREREESLGYQTPTGFHDHLAKTADLRILDDLDRQWLALIGGAAPASDGGSPEVF